MAEETQPKAEEVPVVKTAEEPTKPAAEAPPAAAEDAPPPATAEGEEAEVSAADMPQSMSFKEESNVVADLPESEKKALDEFKALIAAALAKNEFSPPPPKPQPEESKPAEEPKVEGEPKAEEEPKGEVPSAAAADAAEAKGKKPIADEVIVEHTPPPAEEKSADLIEISAKAVEAIPAAAGEIPASDPPPPAASPEEIIIWGVPLVGDERTDTILLKFLRARDFKVKDSLTMLKNTVLWRKAFGIHPLLQEDLHLPEEMNKVVFMNGKDREGHPVCYNVYEEFQDNELYGKVFGDEEKKQRFLRWRIQFLEKGILQQLDFTPGAVSTMVQVNDLKNFPVAGKRDLRITTNQALALLQDNYPEFVAKQVFINVPWWYLAYNRMISPFLTQRTKSKFVFSAPSKSADTLFKYIAPEQVPVRYGGLSKENDPDFTFTDVATEITIKPSSLQTIDIPVSKACLLVWELRVLGWDVTYSAEFVPVAAGGYTVIIQKARKVVATDEPVVKNVFKVVEPGKIVLTIDNVASKKKKLLYRSKIKSSTESA